MKLILSLLLLVSLVQAGVSQNDTIGTTQSAITHKIEEYQLSGGWHSVVEGRALFVDVSKNGAVSIDLQGGMDIIHQQIVDLSKSTLVLYPISSWGIRYVSGLGHLKEEERKKAIAELDKTNAAYKYEGDSLQIKLEGSPWQPFGKCKFQDCRDLKPDNMRFANWAFDLDVVEVPLGGWEPAEENPAKHLVIAKPVKEVLSKISDKYFLFARFLPIAGAPDPIYLHQLVDNQELNLVVDTKTEIKIIQSFLQAYIDEYPETIIYVIGTDRNNNVVRKRIDLNIEVGEYKNINSWANSN